EVLARQPGATELGRSGDPAVAGVEAGRRPHLGGGDGLRLRVGVALLDDADEVVALPPAELVRVGGPPGRVRVEEGAGPVDELVEVDGGHDLERPGVAWPAAARRAAVSSAPRRCSHGTRIGRSWRTVRCAGRR